MSDSIFLTLQEVREQEEYYQEIERQLEKFYHFLIADNDWLQQVIDRSTDPEAVEFASNLLSKRKNDLHNSKS